MKEVRDTEGRELQRKEQIQRPQGGNVWLERGQRTKKVDECSQKNK